MPRADVLLLLSLALASPLTTYAQECPHREYAWTRTVGGEWGDYLLGGVTVDNHDNVLIAGEFEGKVDFDPGPGKDNRRPQGDGDAYVAWYSADGEYKGAYTFGARPGPEFRFNWALGLDRRPAGGFVLGGLFVGKTDFDPTDGRDMRKSNGVEDAYVVAFRDDYTYDWTWTVGGTDFETIRAVAVNRDDTILAAGYFDGSMFLGEGEARREFVSNGWSDVFVVKLSRTGQLLWATAFGGAERDVPEAVTVDADRAVIIVGTYRGEVDFDPLGSHAIRTSNGGEDLFVLKLSAEGRFDWLRTIGGERTDRAYSVEAPPTGQVYVGGYFSKVVDFDPEGGGDVHNSGEAPAHAFITRYAGDGAYSWTKTFGGEAQTYVIDLVVDRDRLLLTGGYLGTVDLDPGEGVDERPAFGARSNYVSYWTPDGTYLLGDAFGGDGFDRTMGIAADREGSVYVAGDFDSLVADFDPTAGVSKGVSHGGTDIFVTRFNCGQCEYVDRHDLEYDGGVLRSTVYTLAPKGKVTVVLRSDGGETKKSKKISTEGFADVRFENLPSGEYECAIRRVRDFDGRELCAGEIAKRRIVIP